MLYPETMEVPGLRDRPRESRPGTNPLWDPEQMSHPEDIFGTYFIIINSFTQQCRAAFLSGKALRKWRALQSPCVLLGTLVGEANKKTENYNTVWEKQ